MCGVAGILDLTGRPVEASAVAAFLAPMRARGPDGEGVWTDGAVGLGHVRLAVLAPGADGRQPMASAEGDLVVSFNGEIYNFLELRDELRQLGHVFRGESDTEVILAAYRQWGLDCQLRFNGMWAFALWDARRRELVLSRDRFGVKPLHFLAKQGRLAFASELKAFTRLAGFAPRLEPGVVARAIVDPQQVEGGVETLLAEVRHLPAGHCLVAGLQSGARLLRWWRTVDHLPEISADPGSQVEEFRARFLDACRLRLRSDVPIATALSGGLDSSSVHMALAHLVRDGAGTARAAPASQNAIVACFPGLPIDERAHAEAVLAASRATPHFVDIDAGDVAAHVDEIVWAQEEIYELLSSPWSVYRACRAQGIKVSLDGHGGDELLGGYVRQVRSLANADPPPLPRETLIEVLEGMSPAKTTAAAPLPQRRAWLNVKPAPAQFAGYEQDMKALAGRDVGTRLLYQDFHFTVLPTILRNFDRCSMAHGVEIRAPLMDWRLVTYGFALPLEAKLGRGFSKLVLREAMRPWLPPAIADRKVKQGLVAPLDVWSLGALQPYFMDTLRSAAFRRHPWWQGEAIAAHAEASLARGDGTALRQVWEFVNAFRLEQLFAARTLEAAA